MLPPSLPTSPANSPELPDPSSQLVSEWDTSFLAPRYDFWSSLFLFSLTPYIQSRWGDVLGAGTVSASLHPLGRTPAWPIVGAQWMSVGVMCALFFRLLGRLLKTLFITKFFQTYTRRIVYLSLIFSNYQDLPCLLSLSSSFFLMKYFKATCRYVISILHQVHTFKT